MSEYFYPIKPLTPGEKHSLAQVSSQRWVILEYDSANDYWIIVSGPYTHEKALQRLNSIRVNTN